MEVREVTFDECGNIKILAMNGGPGLEEIEGFMLKGAQLPPKFETLQGIVTDAINGHKLAMARLNDIIRAEGMAKSRKAMYLVQGCKTVDELYWVSNSGDPNNILPKRGDFHF